MTKFIIPETFEEFCEHWENNFKRGLETEEFARIFEICKPWSNSDELKEPRAKLVFEKMSWLHDRALHFYAHRKNHNYEACHICTPINNTV